MDYRTINIGQETASGTVKHIYGQAEDFIVFLDTTDEPRVFTEREDDVYLKAVNISKELSAKAFEKLNKVGIYDLNDHLSACLVDALRPDVKTTDLEKIFNPVKEYIKKKEKVKRVIARGPNPQHIVYVSKSNNVGWQLKHIPDHCKNQLAKLDGLKQKSLTLIPNFLRGSVASSIGNSAASVIRSNEGDDLSELIKDSEEQLESRVKEFNFILYFFSSIIITLIVYGIIYFSKLYENNYALGILGGSLGALISALQRTKQDQLSIYESRIMIAIQALSRGLVGLISGVLLVAASEADVAMGFISDSPKALFIFAVAVGFVERWMPDFLKSLTQKSIEDSDSA